MAQQWEELLSQLMPWLQGWKLGLTGEQEVPLLLHSAGQFCALARRVESAPPPLPTSSEEAALCG